MTEPNKDQSQNRPQGSQYQEPAAERDKAHTTDEQNLPQESNE